MAINLTGLGGPRPAPGKKRIDISGLGGAVKEEMHPGITVGDRAKIMNLASQPEVGARYLRDKGFEVQTDGGYTMRVRKPGEKEWRRLDPQGFDWQDLLDIWGDTASGVASGLGGAAGAIAAGGTTLGLGTLAGGAGGAALGAGAASAAKSALGEGLGLHSTGEEVIGGMASEALGAGIMEPAAILTAGAARAAGPAVKGVIKSGMDAITPAAAAVRGGVKAIPRAVVAAGKDAVRKAASLPGLGAGGREIAKGMKQGWQGARGAALRTPEMEEAIARAQQGLPHPTGGGGAAVEAPPIKIPPEMMGPVSREIRKGQIPLEELHTPAAQEIAKKAIAGEPIEPLEESILGRSMGEIMTRSVGADVKRPPSLPAAERAAQQLIWEHGFAGDRLNPRGDPFRVDWIRRTNSTRAAGKEEGEIESRWFNLRPSFASRAETSQVMNRANMTDDALREALRKQNVTGARVSTTKHDGTQYFSPFMKNDAKGTRTAVVPLEKLSRKNLEEFFFQLQPDKILWNKGGAFNPNRYKLHRAVDTDKSLADLRLLPAPGGKGEPIPKNLPEFLKDIFPPVADRYYGKEFLGTGKSSFRSFGLDDIVELEVGGKIYTRADLEKIGNSLFTDTGEAIKPAGGWGKGPGGLPVEARAKLKLDMKPGKKGGSSAL